MDRDQLADFLRVRREALQPEDVGLARGPRRRTSGLRREEVAALAGMSVDYLNRLEQRRGPQPSTQLLGALARALRLDGDERDHLLRLAGHAVDPRVRDLEHVSPAMLRILDRLDDTPAMVLSPVAETLVQNRLAIALLGDHAAYRGLDRSTVHRWFTHPESRDVYPVEDQPGHARVFTAELRAALTLARPDSRAAAIVASLTESSAEFRALWAEHEVSAKHPRTKRIVHGELGVLTLTCQILVDQDSGQHLLTFTAPAGSPDADRLALLGVIGTQQLID